MTLLLLLFIVALAKRSHGWANDTNAIFNDNGYSNNKINTKQEPIVLPSFKKIQENTSTIIEVTNIVTPAPTPDQTIEQKKGNENLVTEEVAPSIKEKLEPIVIRQNGGEGAGEHMNVDIPQFTEEKDNIKMRHTIRDDKHHQDTIEKNKDVLEK